MQYHGNKLTGDLTTFLSNGLPDLILSIMAAMGSASRAIDQWSNHMCTLHTCGDVHYTVHVRGVGIQCTCMYTDITFFLSLILLQQKKRFFLKVVKRLALIGDAYCCSFLQGKTSRLDPLQGSSHGINGLCRYMSTTDIVLFLKRNNSSSSLTFCNGHQNETNVNSGTSLQLI